MTISWTEFSLFFLPEYSKHETGAMNKKLVLLARKKKYAPLRQMRSSDITLLHESYVNKNLASLHDNQAAEQVKGVSIGM